MKIDPHSTLKQNIYYRTNLANDTLQWFNGRAFIGIPALKYVALYKL